MSMTPVPCACRCLALPLGLLLALMGVLVLSGCSYVEPKITEPHRVYYDEPVETSGLAVYVRPKHAAQRGLSAYYMPLLVVEEMKHPRTIGAETMRGIWQTWLTQNVFPIQVYDDSQLYYNREYALRQARNRNADLLVTGQVSHYLSGGTQGDSSLSLRLDIYDTASGQLLWSMAQSALMQKTRDEDFILAKRVQRLPENPMQTMIQRIALEMGQQVQAWAR